MSKATYTIGVFGLACWNDNGTLRIKVNERTDQERQRKNVGLPDDSTIKIIDMPGGGVQLEDFPHLKQASLLNVLKREVSEETGGCTIISISRFSEPFMVVTNTQNESKPAGDIAFWIPIILKGKLQPTDEAADHPWITLKQLEEETEYRAVGGLGRAGRTGRMIYAAFEWFAEHKKDSHLFSTPE